MLFARGARRDAPATIGQNYNLGTDLHAIEQVDDILVQHADAAARHALSDA